MFSSHYRSRRTSFPIGTTSLVLAEMGMILIIGHLMVGNITPEEAGLLEKLPVDTKAVSRVIRVSDLDYLTVHIDDCSQIFLEGRYVATSQFRKVVLQRWKSQQPPLRGMIVHYTPATNYQTYLLAKDLGHELINRERTEISERSTGEPYSDDMPFQLRKDVLRATGFTYWEVEDIRVPDSLQQVRWVGGRWMW